MARATDTVRIVGGGLTGIMAALQAHRLGVRDIVLHEHFEGLGGRALPRQAHGLEHREAALLFGPAGDRLRTLFETCGLAFETVENRCGSVSPGRGGEMASVRDFDGPVVAAGDPTPAPLAGPSLADRIRAYPQEIASALCAYARWRVGGSLEILDASAAVRLGIERVRTAAGEAPCADLYGEAPAETASLPQAGFVGFFADCRRSLETLGVEVRTGELVSPHQALAQQAKGDTVVWAADPAPLFKPAGLTLPVRAGKPVATYIFKARYGGAAPFRVRNFMAKGTVFELYVYESGGQTLLTASCVEEWPDEALRREIYRLMDGFGGASLHLGELVATNVETHAVPTVEGVEAMAALRIMLSHRPGGGFIAGAWEGFRHEDRLDELSGALTATLRGAARAA